MKKKLIIALIPVVIFVGAHYGITLVDNVLKVGRMWETPAVRPYEQPLLVMEKGVVPISGGEAIFRATPPADLHPPSDDPAATSVARGKIGYSLFCAQCHGTSHDGNGTVGQSFAPLPTDLRSPKVQSQSPGQLFKEISFGRPEGRQPALATTISVTDRWSIVAYVKSLGVRE
ncbi:hypothetical protein D3OALGB2SA_1137 [Olavius algarvensis associated proteobacterium Delta 3]|nr:hypothetical protein D3OALGB2SA_1137 [Olavius algarvensis associated proteobacterium Delta 3]